MNADSEQPAAFEKTTFRCNGSNGHGEWRQVTEYSLERTGEQALLKCSGNDGEGNCVCGGPCRWDETPRRMEVILSPELREEER